MESTATSATDRLGLPSWRSPKNLLGQTGSVAFHPTPGMGQPDLTALFNDTSLPHRPPVPHEDRTNRSDDRKRHTGSSLIKSSDSVAGDKSSSNANIAAHNDGQHRGEAMLPVIFIR